MRFNGTLLFEDEPERECWHEAGHAVVAHHFGMQVIAIGFSWVNGEQRAPYPCSWIPDDGFPTDSRATELCAGMASEIIKLGNYDMGAYRSDMEAWKKLGCASSPEHYVDEAIKILNARDGSLVRVYKRLLDERTNPSHQPFVDSGDNMKKQKHLTQQEFESLL